MSSLTPCPKQGIITFCYHTVPWEQILKQKLISLQSQMFWPNLAVPRESLWHIEIASLQQVVWTLC